MKLFSPTTVRVFSAVTAFGRRKVFLRIIVWVVIPIGLAWLGWTGISWKMAAYFKKHPTTEIYVELPKTSFLLIVPKAEGQMYHIFGTRFQLSTSSGYIFFGWCSPPPKPAGEPDLCWQAKLNNIEAVRAILAEGGDPNVKGTNGLSALFYAAGYGNTKMARELIAKGANLDVNSSHGMTPLMKASSVCSNEVLEMLINAGADVNPRYDDGTTALMNVASRVDPDSYPFKDYTWKDNDGNYFVEFPKQNPLATAEILIRAGSDVNAQNKNGKTALMSAAGNGYTRMSKFLIEHGANPKTKDNNGKTAEDYAAEAIALGLSHR